MLSLLAPEELAAGLDAVVMEVLDEAGLTGPPVDAFAVARALQITVAEDDRQTGRARYVRLGRPRAAPRPTVLLRCEPRWERRQWALAHEVGEHVAWRVFARWGVDPRETAPHAREAVATQLAGRLLLPSAWFEPDGTACRWDLPELKTRFATASHELIARRMLECRPPVVITIFDHGAVSLRRSNVPGRVPPLSAVEKERWRTAHESNTPVRCEDGPRLVQAWPVHEAGWRREILRAEVEEFVGEF